MNYYSKLRRVTSNAFPNLVPVSSKFDINNLVIPPTLLQEQIQGAAQSVKNVEALKAVEMARFSSRIPRPQEGRIGVVLSHMSTTKSKHSL